MSNSACSHTVPAPTLPDAVESSCSVNGSWYAIRVRSNFENTASANLQGKGYNVFLPMYSNLRRWSDRVQKISAPLFPGYLFCHFNVQDRLLPILTTPGVVSIVGAGKTPLPVDDHEIAAIRSILLSGLAVQPWPFLGSGSEVYIESGPLAGVQGIVTNSDKVCRLIVSVNLLGRSVAVKIDRGSVRPIPTRVVSSSLLAAEPVR